MVSLFFLVSASQENDYLKKALNQAVSRNTRCEELEKSNNRLRKILRFNEDFENNILVAEVVAKEPSIWFKSIIINKGIKDGLHDSLPVVIPQGVVGVITNVSDNYSKVMLLIDQSSGIDVIVQRTRVRGIVKGGAAELCTLEYVSRRYDIRVGDVIISSGLDGIFPKGLRVGHVSDVIGQHVDIFQKIVVTPYVNFETVEEVIVILNPRQHEDMSIK
ncbi:Rod shape-determining protein C [Desulfonema limicola]|uniref:Cell shape-determining protein MreC n=1 Tax=Desulfonema limicola TaxID=45656 RepID=A0A975B4E6_9BACT|nr:rod shape-determining protein MreC [Desulfonema limicola]QTA78577.1 Rod shape-determining protein C [Desulfonema limicola]